MFRTHTSRDTRARSVRRIKTFEGRSLLFSKAPREYLLDG